MNPDISKALTGIKEPREKLIYTLLIVYSIAVSVLYLQKSYAQGGRENEIREQVSREYDQKLEMSEDRRKATLAWAMKRDSLYEDSRKENTELWQRLAYKNDTVLFRQSILLKKLNASK